jgi:dTDP-4-amino-4,6-dideoxygalactose transaminase
MVERGLGDVALPVAERAAGEVLSLPIHPSVTAEDIEYIARVLGAALDALA